MRKFLILFVMLFCTTAIADTIDINWLNEDGTIYDTSTCTVGGDVVLPTAPTKYGYTFQGWSRYIPIEYLESTGTQYIDTGIVAKSSLRISLLLYIPTNPSSGIGFPFGVRTNSAYFAGMFFPNYSSNQMRFDYYTKTDINCTAAQSLCGKVVLIDMNNNHNVSIYDRDNNLLCRKDLSITDFVTNANMILFGLRNKDTILMVPTTKIYNVKIWDNDTLVRDFIPALDHNGVACMFDKVSRTFFYNAGTGDFIAGPLIAE